MESNEKAYAVVEDYAELYRLWNLVFDDVACSESNLWAYEPPAES